MPRGDVNFHSLIQCPKCFQRDSFDESPEAKDASFCGIFTLIHCRRCDINFLHSSDGKYITSISDQIANIKKKYRYKNINFNTVLRELIDNTKITDKEYKLAISLMTSMKELLIERLTAPINTQHIINERINYLKSTNSLLVELEQQLAIPIPQLESIDFDTFGYVANNHSILGVNLSNMDLKYLSDNVPLFPNIRYLMLHDNFLTHLPTTVANFQRLEMLTLHGNPRITYPEELTKLRTLKSLTLTDNNQLVKPQFLDWIEALLQNRCTVLIY